MIPPTRRFRGILLVRRLTHSAKGSGYLFALFCRLRRGIRVVARALVSLTWSPRISGAQALPTGSRHMTFTSVSCSAFVIGLPVLMVFFTSLAIANPRARIRVPNRDFWLAPERRRRDRGVSEEWRPLVRRRARAIPLHAHWLVVLANEAHPARLSEPWFIGGLLVFAVVMFACWVAWPFPPWRLTPRSTGRAGSWLLLGGRARRLPYSLGLMPIVDVTIVVGRDEKVAAGLTQTLADEVGRVLNSSPGQTWVRLHLLAQDRYAENNSSLGSTELPVFVVLLTRQLPDQVATRLTESPN